MDKESRTRIEAFMVASGRPMSLLGVRRRTGWAIAIVTTPLTLPLLAIFAR